MQRKRTISKPALGLLKNVHPGEILKKDFLDEFGITSNFLAKAINVDQSRINQLLNGKRSVTTDTALRLGKFFNISPEFWLNLQTRFDLVQVRKNNKTYDNISPYHSVNG